MTDKYCVMGNPVAHSKSPWIHARFAELTGQDLVYEKRLISLDGFIDGIHAFRAEGGRGCNITVPFKFQAPSLATRMTPRAQLAQAANVLRFDGDEVLADNTDGIGLVDDIQGNANVELRGHDVLLIGAGGAAAGVLGPLIEARPRRVVVANRTQSRAAELIERHAGLALMATVDPQSTTFQRSEAYRLAVDKDRLRWRQQWMPYERISDNLKRAVIASEDSTFTNHDGVDWAQQHGAVGRDGLGMLVEQAAEAFLVWRGVRPPSAQVLAELRATLAA